MDVAPPDNGDQPTIGDKSVADVDPAHVGDHWDVKLPLAIEVDWQPNFALCGGVNAVTGELSAQAVEQFTPVLAQSKDSHEKVDVLHNVTQLAHAQTLSLGGSFNIVSLGVGAGTTASLTSKINISATSFSVVAKYRSFYEQPDRAPVYKLTKDAVQLLSSPGKFRQRYGDYFIAGGRRGSTFTAVVTCTSADASSLRRFENQFTVKGDQVFDVNVAATLDKSAADTQVRIAVEISRQGYQGDGGATLSVGSLSKVVEALATFKQSEHGVYTHALLLHYSSIEAARDVPQTIPDIEQAVFDELRELYSLLLSARVMADSCPRTEGRSDLEAQVGSLRSKTVDRQAVLATAANVRATLLDETRKLHGRLQSIHNRYKFFVDVESIIATEPKGERHTAAKNIQQWSWGFRACADDKSITVQSTSFNLDLPPTIWPSRRDSVMTCVAPDHSLIVGWEVAADRADGHNGSWRKLSRNFLLAEQGRVTFRTNRFRGAAWEVIIYYVSDPVFCSFRRCLIDANDEPTQDVGAIVRTLRSPNDRLA